MLLLGVVAVGWVLVQTAAGNLARCKMNFSFGFLADLANFDIPFHLVDWHVGDTYARALLVCAVNPLLVAGMGIVASV